MSSRAVTITTIAGAVVTVIGAIAVNGKGVADALAAFPKVLQAYSEGLPLGLTSSLLAFVLACLVWLTLRARLTIKSLGRDGRDFRADNFALATSLIVTIGQTVAAGRSDAYGLLTAGMMGMMTGLAAPWLMRGLRAWWCHAGDDDASPEQG